MLTKEEAIAIISLMNKAPITGAEAEAAVHLKQKVASLVEDAEESETEEG